MNLSQPSLNIDSDLKDVATGDDLSISNLSLDSNNNGFVGRNTGRHNALTEVTMPGVPYPNRFIEEGWQITLEKPLHLAAWLSSTVKPTFSLAQLSHLPITKR